jgi:hypothetical protein
MKSGCPWECGTPTDGSCADQLMTRTLASMLWLILLVSIIAGIFYE